MFVQRTTPADTPGEQGIILPLATDDDDIGGKARSLARLAALGLPVPPGFAIGAKLFRGLRAAGPVLPADLQSAADLATLDAAREAMGTARFPAGFEEALLAALDRVAVTAAGPFAVRSSAPTDDQPGALGAGIHASVFRVPRGQVANAVRTVLASFLTPAAWVYAARHALTGATAGTDPPRASVLIHPFVVGDAAGTAAFSPARPPPAFTAPERPVASRRKPADLSGVRIDVHVGEPTATARDHIQAATKTAAAQFGPIEIEWVADADHVTFLQLRPYDPAPDQSTSAPRPRGDAATGSTPGTNASGPAGWTWDAAHNPDPLSPAQAGLVALVDERCRIGIRQRVADGYLFWQATVDAPPPTDVTDARATLDALGVDIKSRLELAPEPSLTAALDLYVAAYESLFGIVGPAAAAARKDLAVFLGRHLPDHVPEIAPLLGGVPSVASRRRAAADEIAAAIDAPARQSAIDAYLRDFGDESPRWDVAEPTLRERPLPLVLWSANGATAPRPPGTGDAGASADEHATAMARRLAPSERARFGELLATARAAIAVGEDDDALFACLQACVRAALLRLGQRLVAAGRLGVVDDVFYLPLSLARVLDDPGSDPKAGGDASASIDPAATDLGRLAAVGRDAFRAARLDLPRSKTDSSQGLIVRGRGGAGGRTVGRVVHHPPSTPLSADAVLVAATLLPTELPLLSPAAIVVETGEVLGHVAAQARERGIPAVVGATGARAALPEGTVVVVDGDRGEIIRLGSP